MFSTKTRFVNSADLWGGGQVSHDEVQPCHVLRCAARIISTVSRKLI